MSSESNFRLHCGLQMTVVGDSVLINAADSWELASSSEFSKEAEDILKRSTKEDRYYYWWNWEVKSGS